MKRREIIRKFPEIVEFAGVEKFIDTPVKRYSSGMSVRLAFAVAAYLEPEILLVDEVLAVGDAEFQRRSLGRMEDLSQSGRTVLFVSHNMQAVAQLCDRALLLDGGRIVNDGPSAEVVAEYLQAGHGSSSSRAWGELDDAPGDELVRLRSARVLQDGAVTGSVDVRKPVGIEIVFTVLRRRGARVPEDQGLRPAGRGRVQRAGHERALAGASHAGRVRLHRLDPRQLAQRGPDQRGRRNLLARRHEVPPSRGGGRRRVVPRSRPGAGGLGARPVHRAGAGRRPALARVERGRAIVGIVLVRNEDVFLEQAIRNVASFCDRIHAVDHVSTDGTWEVLRRLDRELDHLDVRRARHAGESHKLVEPYAGTATWVFGVDGDELYDPAASRGLSRGAARRRVRRRLQGCLERRSTASSSTGRRGTATGYLSPPSRSITKLYNFAAIESWRGDGAERLHGGTIVFRDGYDESAVDNIGERLPWEETPLRCLHACFLRRSTQEPEHTGAPAGRPILEETGMQDRSVRGRLKRRLRRHSAPAGLRVEEREVHARRPRHRRRRRRFSGQLSA